MENICAQCQQKITDDSDNPYRENAKPKIPSPRKTFLQTLKDLSINIKSLIVRNRPIYYGLAIVVAIALAYIIFPGFTTVCGIGLFSIITIIVLGLLIMFLIKYLLFIIPHHIGVFAARQFNFISFFCGNDIEADYDDVGNGPLAWLFGLLLLSVIPGIYWIGCWVKPIWPGF